MNHVLTVYSAKAYKTYLLPYINNSDYTISINKDLFCLDAEAEILMEVVDNKWKFLSSDDYIIEKLGYDRVRYEDKELIDDDIISIIFPGGENLSVMYDVSDALFGVFNKFDLYRRDEISIGKSEKNKIVFGNKGLISKEHAVIRNINDRWVIEDKSKNGIFVNSKRVVNSRQLQFGDTISIFGLTITFLDSVLAINDKVEGISVKDQTFSKHIFEQIAQKKTTSKYQKKKTLFHRSPRIIYQIEKEPVDIEPPPQPKQINRKPLGLIIGPSITMAMPMLMGSGLAIFSAKMNGGTSSTFMYTGLITAISSAVIGTIWSITNLKFEKKKNREEEVHRLDAYSEYLVKITNQIKEKYEKNISRLNSMYVSSDLCCENNSDSTSLWSRNSSHKDYLSHRLGIGDMPFQIQINIPKDRFTLINDTIADKPAMIKDSFKVLHNVPICVDLIQHRVVGIVSTSGKKGATDVMHNLVAQIAASNCYTDVKMAFLYDKAEEDETDWGYLKWLPHVWSEDKRGRYFAEDRNEVSDVLYELTKVLRNRAEVRGTLSSSTNSKLPCPQYILFISNPNMLEGELITKYLFEENNEDITTVLLSDGFENLPNICDFIIQNDNHFRGMYSAYTNYEERTPIVFDSVSNLQLERLSRTLADIEVSELETGGDIPTSLNFFDMYGVNSLDELNVMEKWRKNRTYDSMKALIGQRAGGMPWYLDVHEKYHGPHGLIAGTTGSGKSETLQTYILSLALQFSPDDVGFFIIDYKGGGMANLFDGLPHMIGAISNLSGNQVKRAMVSIKSENKRRQRVFNEHGVNNINLYTRLYKNNEASLPVPHMFIIIDEFAELKREEPDFMRELISVAQVGRSLGVHLILATQKPSGTVDDNIWSNSKFRLCLRVQDRQDSNDMLHRPDAAYITQAGRCYMQVGNDELFELFQSGYSGDAYDEEMGNNKTDIAKMVSSTGKAALVGNRLKIRQQENAKRRWIRTLVLAIEAAGFGEGSDEMAFFDYLEKKGIEYPYSDYNAARIRDLLKIINRVSASFKEHTKDEYIDAIIASSVLTRKKLPEKKEKTQLDAVVEYLAEMAKKNGYVNKHQLWLPVLPEIISLEQLKGYNAYEYFNGTEWAEKKEWSLEVPIGMYDDPVNQSQDTVTINLSENGHHAIIGTVVSGKSTFVQTFIYVMCMKYNADWINIYALDYSAKMSAAFEKMPQVGGVILENDDDKLAKFINMLNTILEERKEIFKGGNYSQYVRANGVIIPAIIVCIDNFSNFSSKTNGAYNDFILKLSKDGASYGIYIIATAGGFNISEIPNRIGENFRTVICLELADKFQYSDALHTMKIDTLPEVNIKGRGLVHVGDTLLEFQTALCMDEIDDFKRMEEIQKLAIMMQKNWAGKIARTIPSIPENPVWADFIRMDEFEKAVKDSRYLPIGYNAENASPYSIDLAKTYCYVIGGKRRTGKTNMLKAIICSALLSNAQVTVIDFAGDLRVISDKNGIDVIDSDQQLEAFCIGLRPDFIERNKVKKELERNGSTDEEIYAEVASKFTRKIIIISSLADFANHVVNPAGANSVKAFIENLLDKGALHNVFWFASHNYDDNSRVVGNNVYDLFVRSRKGIHFGGNVASQRLFIFDTIPYIEQTRGLKAGIGMIPASDNEKEGKVIVPLVK